MTDNKNQIDDIVVDILNTNTTSDNSEQTKGINEIEKSVTSITIKPQSSKDNRTTSMVLAIIFFVASIIFAIITVWKFLDVYSSVDTGQEGLNGFVTFLSFLLFYGFFTYIPSFIFCIVGIVMSGIGLGSESKGRKIVCGIFLFLNIVVLIALIGVLGLAVLLPGASS